MCVEEVISINKENRGILVGLALGDGHIKKFQKSGQQGSEKPHYAMIEIRHCEAQKEFIEYKADLLHSVLGGKRPKVSFINNNGFPAYSIRKVNSYFRNLHSWMYVNKKKIISRKILDMLTIKGIALWYMDDGNLSAKKRNGKIHAYELFINTHEDRPTNQIIIDYFKEVHGINFGQTKNNGSYRLRCGTREARKFLELVRPYIIPSMQYKIEMK